MRRRKIPKDAIRKLGAIYADSDLAFRRTAGSVPDVDQARLLLTVLDRLDRIERRLTGHEGQTLQ